MNVGVILLYMVIWSKDVPKLTSQAYLGPTGWHETIADGKMDFSRESIGEAIAICRAHQWEGYVRYTSTFGKEVDSCKFIHKVVQ